MYQKLVLDVPKTTTCLKTIRGVPPNVLLACEPWGHIDHAGSECQCLSSDRTGAYIHPLSIDQSHRDCTSSPLLSPPDLAPGEKIPDDSSVLVSTKILSIRPGLVPFVSHRDGAFVRLLLAPYECMMTGGLSACDWLTHVTWGGWRVAAPGHPGG